MACPSCNFVNWGGPTLVVAVIIPDQNGLVMGKRGVRPVGKWCFPCGFVDRHECSDEAAVREPLEEVGLITKPNRFLGNFCPTPAKNQNIALYLSRVIGGTLQAGSDITEVGIFTRENRPDFAFDFHEIVFDAWFDGKIKLSDEDQVPFKF